MYYNKKIYGLFRPYYLFYIFVPSAFETGTINREISNVLKPTNFLKSFNII